MQPQQWNKHLYPSLRFTPRKSTAVYTGVEIIAPPPPPPPPPPPLIPFFLLLLLLAPSINDIAPGAAWFSWRCGNNLSSRARGKPFSRFRAPVHYSSLMYRARVERAWNTQRRNGPPPRAIGLYTCMGLVKRVLGGGGSCAFFLPYL